MIRNLTLFTLLFVTTHLAAHFATVHALPGLIMDRATSILEGRGAPINAWSTAPRISPETQTIVRSSPDLAYSVCLLDVSKGPVYLSVPRWDNYGSLSIFQGTTENVFVGNLEGSGTLGLVVTMAGETANVPDDTAVVPINSERGIALIRHLAPRKESYLAAAALTSQSECKTE